jgi:hypothetical protein
MSHRTNSSLGANSSMLRRKMAFAVAVAKKNGGTLAGPAVVSL